MTLTTQIKSVLERYSIKCDNVGINTNLRQWERNKNSLVELLRSHPQWNEDALAVIFEVSENREANRTDITNYMRDVIALADDMEMSDIERDNFKDAVYYACDDCTKTIDRDSVANRIKEISGVNCVTGQKVSKVVNAICKKYGVDKHTEYNRRFAKLADSLNPLQIKKKALLSVHPCDFLEMSSDRNSWNSCHRINGGEYQAGTLSYMNDSTSMIFYTVDDKVTEDFYNAPKHTRQVFVYGDGILMQSRLYPSNNDTAIDNYRGVVQKAIAKCINEPNFWTLEREQSSVDEHIETHEDALHYRDYDHEWANISLLKSIDTAYTAVSVGYTAYCLDCGDNMHESGSLHCDDCGEGRYSCYGCDDRIDEDDIVWVEGDTYCTDCAHYCEHCHENFTGDSYTVHNSRGYNMDVCESCAQEDFYYCENCYEYHHSDNTYSTDNGSYCNDCFHDNFTRCTKCDDDVNNDDIEEVDGEYYCESCADDVRAELEENEEAA